MCSLWLNMFGCGYLPFYSFSIMDCLSGVSLCRARYIILDPEQFLIHHSKNVTDSSRTVRCARPTWDVLVGWSPDKVFFDRAACMGAATSTVETRVGWGGSVSTAHVKHSNSYEESNLQLLCLLLWMWFINEFKDPRILKHSLQIPDILGVGYSIPCGIKK